MTAEVAAHVLVSELDFVLAHLCQVTERGKQQAVAASVIARAQADTHTAQLAEAKEAQAAACAQAVNLLTKLAEAEQLARAGLAEAKKVTDAATEKLTTELTAAFF